MHKNVWILVAAQALMMSLNSLNVFVGGLVGAHLAPAERLSTLPVASIVVGTAVFSLPVTGLMKTWGRKKSFLSVAIYSIVISLLCAWSISISNFYLFVGCTFLLGLTSACIMQFRFAAMESVKHENTPKAASFVLIGGIVAAFIGPEIGLWGKDLFSTAFTGSYLMLAVLFALGFVILLTYQNTEIKISKIEEAQRPLSQIIKQPVLWVAIMGATIGYAVMTFIMTATPMSMHVMDGHTLSDTKWVIQSHIVAMFLPSIFTGFLIKTFGVVRLMIAGLLIYLLCIIIGFAGHMLHHYWVSLILLGLGWNFLFVGGTSLLPAAYQSSERFKVQGLNEAILFISQAVASLSAGWVVFSLGWETLLLLTIPFILVQFGALWFWKSGKRITQ